MSLNKFKELGEPIPKEKIILPLKHELFAQELIKTKGNQTQAYANVYDKPLNAVTTVEASRLLSKVSVRSRVVQVLNESNLSIERLGKKLNSFVDSENEGIGLEATKTAFKLHDAFPSDKKTQESQDNVINIYFEKVVVNRTPEAKQ